MRLSHLSNLGISLSHSIFNHFELSKSILSFFSFLSDHRLFGVQLLFVSSSKLIGLFLLLVHIIQHSRQFINRFLCMGCSCLQRPYCFVTHRKSLLQILSIMLYLFISSCKLIKFSFCIFFICRWFPSFTLKVISESFELRLGHLTSSSLIL